MLTKVAFALVLVVGLVASDPQRQDYRGRVSHHLIVGSRSDGGHLLSHQIVTKDSGWLQVQTLDVTFKTPQNQIITQVRALDQKTNGNGAYASITKGGPGNKNVTVHFESQRGYSIKFILEVYGK